MTLKQQLNDEKGDDLSSVWLSCCTELGGSISLRGMG